ncbi:JAB domain-containing protein [Bacillus sp. AFS073361]|uniref:JAB domain-containing protein n=1 Tax=Bacillus sp. AFS073361 TaxID=2033511 RepID=UPI0015D4B70D|nr:JAB domain-containing protein [Bacillus sp. AFS073361]
MRTAKEKYPTARYVKFERIVREKSEGGYYHIPEAIRSPQDAYDTIIELTDAERETQEIFGVVSLNTKNKVLGCEVIHKGSVNASIVHPRDVYKLALLKGATSIMVFHNHPSGNPAPSREDIDVTKRLVECGKLLGIELIDHIIVGDDGDYVSLRDKGYIG